MSKTILVLAPHPDDAEFFAGGTLARWAAEGHRVLIAIATDGRVGSFEHDQGTLAQLRAGEARDAAAVLGAEPPILLGHPDMGLDLLPPGVLREQFVRLIRQVRPDVVVTEGARDLDHAHPDHRQVAWAARDALSAASLPLAYPEQLKEGLQPYLVAEKYFYYETPGNTNIIVDISAFVDKKIAALAAHKTQMVFLVQDILNQARLAGLAEHPLFVQAAADPAGVVALFIQNEAAQAGKPQGFAHGEAFYYERYNPIVESML